MPKIKAIESALPMDGSAWVVGNEVGYKSGDYITEIKDMTVEFDNSIFSQYDIYVNGKLFKTLVNMAVKVEYFLED